MPGMAERLRILSTDSRPFADRAEAGRLLGEALSFLRVEEPVVLGIPRGGLVVAAALAGALEAKVDAVFTLKIGFPGNPEFAVGSVSEGGRFHVDEKFVEKMGIGKFVEEEKKSRLAELIRRSEVIRRHRPRIPLAGRAVVVTDDGVATGATARAALEMVRREVPRKLIGAFPVGEEGAVAELAELTDEMICLRCPEEFRAVSQFYRDYRQVGDEEVERIFMR
jgi:predicted phosphoribosyltransferase